jgi:hypothetical protein
MKGFIGAVLMAIALIIVVAIVIGAVSYSQGINIFEGVVMEAIEAVKSFFSGIFKLI